MGPLWVTLDLAGTAVFAISGAATGVKYRLDVFGICVLAFVAANAGGMLRDVLLGATPPAALSGWHHVTVSLLAALLTFWWHPRLERLRTPILLFDAAGLGLFAVAGTQKALAFGLDPLVAAILGMSPESGAACFVICSSTRFPPCYTGSCMPWLRSPAQQWSRWGICFTFPRPCRR